METFTTLSLGEMVEELLYKKRSKKLLGLCVELALNWELKPLAKPWTSKRESWPRQIADLILNISKKGKRIQQERTKSLSNGDEFTQRTGSCSSRIFLVRKLPKIALPFIRETSPTWAGGGSEVTPSPRGSTFPFYPAACGV